MYPIIVIPAYEPSSELCALVAVLQEARPTQPIIIIDDGSSPNAAPIWAKLPQQITLLRHAINLGKGQALKTAFNYVLLHYPDAPGVITADADGQHLAADIFAVSDALVSDQATLWIGARQFDGNVPFRSKIGNTVTRHVFRLLVGQMIHDTQSGLRGIPKHLLPTLLRISSNRYEFELDMLVDVAKQQHPIREIPIKTVYLNNNQSSHFRPLLDSLRIYFVFLRFCTLSLVTALLDFIVFSIAFLCSHAILFSFITARMVAGSFNFYFGKQLIFKSDRHIWPEALRFTGLVLFLMMISYGLVNSMVYFLDINVYTSKIIAEFGLFLLSFSAQRLFVFHRESK